jgi:hypothetical protein
MAWERGTNPYHRTKGSGSLTPMLEASLLAEYRWGGGGVALDKTDFLAENTMQEIPYYSRKLQV